jgi:hypothetical protein
MPIRGGVARSRRGIDFACRTQAALHGSVDPGKVVSGMLARKVHAAFTAGHDVRESIVAWGRPGRAAAGEANHALAAASAAASVADVIPLCATTISKHAASAASEGDEQISAASIAASTANASSSSLRSWSANCSENWTACRLRWSVRSDQMRRQQDTANRRVLRSVKLPALRRKPSMSCGSLAFIRWLSSTALLLVQQKVYGPTAADMFSRSNQLHGADRPDAGKVSRTSPSRCSCELQGHPPAVVPKGWCDRRCPARCYTVSNTILMHCAERWCGGSRQPPN